MKNNPLQTRVALVFFGVFLFFILLETGLRLGGFVFLSFQDYHNRRALAKKDTYRILCLGESTTACQYPSFLEEILNQRHIGSTFSVIGRGLPGATTSIIVTQLESNLKTYAPDMVVVMMGINDRGGHIPYESVSVSRIALFLRSFRTYHLIRLLGLHIASKADALGSHSPARDQAVPSEESLKKAIELNPGNSDAYIKLGVLYRIQGKFSQAEELLKRAVELLPKDDRACVELGLLYKREGKFPQAEELLKRAVELNPQNDRVCLKLGWFYEEIGKFPQAEKLYKGIIKLVPRRDSAYRALSVLYERVDRPALAREYNEEANRLRLEQGNAVTIHNYRRLKEVLDKRGIRLVCVQYPMRSLEPLKSIFQNNDQGIFFVDNEKIFRDAVKRDGPGAYFTDMFAGDFGHCTHKGNRLLAENIAGVILREISKN
jgi:tetratricopeptide (TPR) repeat protein